MSQPMSETKLVLAVPSKGRLQENANAFFARAGLTVTQGRGARDYRGALSGVENVEVAFLSASEIVKNLAVRRGASRRHRRGSGARGAGRSKVELLTPLGFGHANVVVAAPQAWIDVRTMADLEDVAVGFRARRGERMRVATKYVNTTRAFFRDKGVTDYHIVESLGATEGAPGRGPGRTDRRHHLDRRDACGQRPEDSRRRRDPALRGQSRRLARRRLDARVSARSRGKILSRIAAEEEARTTREIIAILAEEPEDFAARLASFGAQDPPSRRAMAASIFTAPKAQAPVLADWLVGQGAGEVVVRQHRLCLHLGQSALRASRRKAVQGRLPMTQPVGRRSRGHPRHQLAAQPRIRGAWVARVALERIGQGGGEQGRLARGQCSGGFVEIALRRRLGAEQAVSPFGDIKIGAQNPGLGPDDVQSQRQGNFHSLAQNRTARKQEKVFHGLHVDGRGAARRAAVLDLDRDGAQGPPVHAGMEAETRVFRGDHRLHQPG